ncbi:HNH endonuclease [Phenylobacterium sp.]|jgi:hypothetical protein|uniref:HNH endonuclease n=1 Tax=Phenylobacterium sp. TaxID=1871053 RepID=UPI002E2EDCDA|nr:HNH endonuclease [Phenylobacterium sp.]HEX3365773.1 HNH endonuclease [Phenylobacterium sp.]
MTFEPGQIYTRNEVQDLLAVPPDKRQGQWRNGYPKYAGQLFIFCNVGAPGRTGHDYANSWDGDDLVWEGRTGATADQPLMREIASGSLPIHVFWRSDNSDPSFIYRGLGRPVSVERTIPVRFRFSFDGEDEGAQVRGATNEVTLRKLLGDEGQLFAKSEFAPVDPSWPALSFTHRKIADDFTQHFNSQRDFVLVVGTSDPKSTENPAHRSRVLSVATLNENGPTATQDVISELAWKQAVQKWGRPRWEWSLGVVASFDFAAFPEARRVMPQTYSALGYLGNLGRCVRVHEDDLAGLLDLPLVRVLPASLPFDPAAASDAAPISLEDARRRAEVSIALRQGGAAFRAALLRAYGSKCAITHEDAPEALEAAHIVPYLGPQTDLVENGILLRADLHTLFDRQLIDIDPTNLRVSLAPSLRPTTYGKLEGRTLTLPKGVEARALCKMLRIRRELLDAKAAVPTSASE